MNPIDNDDVTASTVRQGLDHWSMAYTDDQIAKLLEFRDMLIDWNATRMNLTRIVEPSAVAVQHFLDSLSILKYCDLKLGSSLLDVGTGAGFPGLALKLFRPDLRVTLLEATAKKLTFCAAVCERLDLSDVKLVHGRAEANPPPVRLHGFDTVTVRAVADLSLLAQWCGVYLSRHGGQMLAMKGSKAPEELESSKDVMAKFGLNASLIAIDLPGSTHNHFIVRCAVRS